jgi:hypothetical protein
MSSALNRYAQMRSPELHTFCYHAECYPVERTVLNTSENCPSRAALQDAARAAVHDPRCHALFWGGFLRGRITARKLALLELREQNLVHRDEAEQYRVDSLPSILHRSLFIGQDRSQMPFKLAIVFKREIKRLLTTHYP